MKILAIDSTAKAASAAVLEDGKTLGEYTLDNGLTQSELLLPMIESLMDSLKIKYSDIGLFATSVGPGSFTGVRIGTAIIKGMAFGTDTACVGVSTLEALAENLNGISGIILPVMDARRRQFYTASFKSSPEGIERLTEDAALGIDEIETLISSYDAPVYIVGDGYSLLKELLLERGIETQTTPSLLITENAASVGKVALRHYLKGNFTNDTDLKPSYLRLPQAERERLERENNSK